MRVATQASVLNYTQTKNINLPLKDGFDT
jgi:hypothetical protein